MGDNFTTKVDKQCQDGWPGTDFCVLTGVRRPILHPQQLEGQDLVTVLFGTLLNLITPFPLSPVVNLQVVVCFKFLPPGLYSLLKS